MGSDLRAIIADEAPAISIHAPRMGSDIKQATDRHRLNHFNPRSPHGERPINSLRQAFQIQFQSTLPAWGATRARLLLTRSFNFNPRSPHGERLTVDKIRDVIYCISIHAPRMGSDIRRVHFPLLAIFQSTLPAWGATPQSLDVWHLSQFQSTLPAWGATGSQFKLTKHG